MLAFTKKTCLGIAAMSFLDRLPPGALAPASRIAMENQASLGLVMNVLKQLASHGYIESVRGPHGGYRIATRPGDVSLVKLVEDLERPVRLAQCRSKLTGDDRECTGEYAPICPYASDPMHLVHRKLSDFLRKITLADVIGSEAAPPATTSDP